MIRKLRAAGRVEKARNPDDNCLYDLILTESGIF